MSYDKCVEGFVNSPSLTQTTLNIKTSLDNIGRFERLKIGASFCSSACNKRTPRFFVFTVHRIAVYLPHSAESYRLGLYCRVLQKPKLRPKDRVSIRTEPLNCRSSEYPRPCDFVACSKS